MGIEDVLNEFLTNYEKLSKLTKEKSAELSKVDIELSDYYHKIEGIHLSHNTQGHGLVVQLKDILDRRRTLKKESTLLRSFIDNTQDSMLKAKNKKVDVLNRHNKLIKSLKKNAE